MIIDMKYHIASLVAVLLALGLGILIGSTILGNNVNEVIVQQQDKIYENLKQDLEQLKNEKKAALEEAADFKNLYNISNDFEKKLMPQLITDKLKGKKVAIIEIQDTSNFPQTEELLINALKTAGCDIASVTKLCGIELLNDEKIRKLLAVKMMLNDGSKTNVLKCIADEIAAGIFTDQNFENLEYFEQLKILSLKGRYGIPVDNVIVVNNSNLKNNVRCFNFDLPVIKKMLSKNVKVYGVEPANIDSSYFTYYNRLKIETVDNIDTIPGQVSLILKMAGMNQ